MLCLVKNLCGEEMADITIKDIAKRCGVSVSTVSRALNDNAEINAETKAMILQVVQETGFVPNNSARNLKRTDTNNIAVLVKGITNPFFASMIKIMEEEIHKRKFSFVLHHVDEYEDEVDVALELIKEKRLKGIVFLGGHFFHSEEKFEQISVPFVFSTVGAKPEDMDKAIYSNIAVDDKIASKKMVSYLIDLGHKDIAVITPEIGERTIGYQRLQGYREALSEKKIKFQEKLVCNVSQDMDLYSMENGFVTTKKLIDSGTRFTAIFAMSDSLAIGACRALKDAGYKIPEDVSVAGYDGIDWGDYYVPRLTTLKQPVEEMAVQTMQLLFNIISGKSKHMHIDFEGEVQIKESTAAPKSLKKK